jgi:hypothetical protein
VETLRLQLDHMRLAAPPPSSAATAAGPGRLLRRSTGLEGLGGGGGSPRGGPAPAPAPVPAHSTGSSRQHSGGGASFLLSARHVGRAASDDAGYTGPAVGQQAGAGRYPEALPESSFEADAASSISGDVFSDLADDGIDSARGMARQGMGMGRQHPASRFAPPAAAARADRQATGAASQTAASLYQQQLHEHIDSLTTKLGSFERAVERARREGSQAASQVRPPGCCWAMGRELEMLCLFVCWLRLQPCVGRLAWRRGESVLLGFCFWMRSCSRPSDNCWMGCTAPHARTSQLQHL